ncbi:MAG: sugar ABC transporter permease [Oscillospiraceae bacterium]|nr:sugar ABC transporter permease [Oscillospiraceae bacterium]
MNYTAVAPRRKKLLKKILRHWQLYLLILPPVVYVIVFRYIPIIGSQIAFRDYKLNMGLFGSKWVGLKHFTDFLLGNQFGTLMKNTLALSFYNIGASFLPPIILALALNYAFNRHFGKTVQMVTYMPYFISTVLVVSIITRLLSLTGPVNNLIARIGGERVLFIGKPEYFRTIYVFSGVWQSTGYNAVVYLAALAAVNPELHEAAVVDGANMWQRVYHVDIPGILPTAIILLILACGKVLTIGYEKVLLLQNLENMSTSDIISTYVYRIGLSEGMQYSFSTAVGLFQSVVSLLLLTVVNWFSRKVSETSLW